MSEHPIAAFADQVEPGMRVSMARPNDWWPEPVLITQTRTLDHKQTGLDPGTVTIHLLGVDDDGRPFAYVARSQMAVLIHDLAPADFLRSLT